MSQITKAILAGLIFGVVRVLVMIPLDFGSKRSKIEAMLASFVDRFLIGFTIVLIDLPAHKAIIGAHHRYSLNWSI